MPPYKIAYQCDSTKTRHQVKLSCLVFSVVRTQQNETTGRVGRLSLALGHEWSGPQCLHRLQDAVRGLPARSPQQCRSPLPWYDALVFLSVSTKRNKPIYRRPPRGRQRFHLEGNTLSSWYGILTVLAQDVCPSRRDDRLLCLGPVLVGRQTRPEDLCWHLFHQSPRVVDHRAGNHTLGCGDYLLTFFQVCNSYSMVTVALYDTLGQDAVVHIIKQCEMPVSFPVSFFCLFEFFFFFFFLPKRWLLRPQTSSRWSSALSRAAHPSS